MKHQLSLSITESIDDWALHIQDVSVYATMIPISCLTLQILLPGFTKAVTFNEDSVPALVPGFSRSFNACALNIQTQNCGTTSDPLPDGLYVIKLSVSPNDYVYAEYNHLRIVQAMLLYKKHLCDLKLSACEPTGPQKARLAELREIRDLLEAAKAMVEVCHEPNEGMELYSYAMSRLKKLKCKSC